MDENYSRTEEKQIFLSESEELSKDEPPADFDISVEELTAKLAEKKLVEEKKAKEEKISQEVKEEFEKQSEYSNSSKRSLNKNDEIREYSNLSKEEKVHFPIKIEEDKPKSFSIKIEEEKPKVEEHNHHVEESFVREPQKHTYKQTFNPRKTFLQRHKWLVLFTIILVSSYFLFHPAENNLSSYATSVSETPIQETVKEIPQTPIVEKIDLREEKLRNLIVEGMN